MNKIAGSMEREIVSRREDPCAGAPPSQIGLRVLLLEDNALDAELIRRELRRADISFTQQCVETRADFIQALREFQPAVILSDFSMPSFTAIEALEILRDHPDPPPFILVTGSQSEEVAVQCMREGADDYILKATLRRLPSAVLNAIKKHGVERERSLTEAQLRQSQKMESIGQLAAGIAHDFNNVLTIIRGYSQMLLEDKQIESHVRDPLEQIAVATERATNLTRQLLMFSRKQVMQPSLMDLNDVISSVTKMLRRILGEDIRLHFHYSPHLPGISGDAGMIEQIILNLAVNARDAMPRGGNLTIGTNTIEITAHHTRANPEAKEGRYVCLRVSDTGSGIAPETLPRIFEPFFTTKGLGKGTGLGLATIYGIVKQHRGWVEVLTELGKGTTFRVLLPATSETGVGGGNLELDLPEDCCGVECVLVVEDEPELRAMVCEILRQYGYTTLSAASGPEAIPIWRQHASKVDLLLTDMVMPGNMTGKELAEKLTADNPRLKVIYTSGYSVEIMANDLGMRRGLNFLQKPYHPRALLKVVRDCLDS